MAHASGQQGTIGSTTSRRRHDRYHICVIPRCRHRHRRRHIVAGDPCRLDVALKVRAVHQVTEVASPAILRVQRFPVQPNWFNDCFAPDDLAVFEEVQINSATLQVDAVHGLGSAGLEVDGLLLWRSGQLTAGHDKPLLSGVGDQFANVQQERGLFSV